MPLKRLIKAKRVINLVAVYNTKSFNKFTFKSLINKSTTNAFKARLKGLAFLTKVKNSTYI
jgi:hypothetical protein